MTNNRMVFADGETLVWRQHNTFLEFLTEGPGWALTEARSCQRLTLPLLLMRLCARSLCSTFRAANVLDMLSFAGGKIKTGSPPSRIRACRPHLPDVAPTALKVSRQHECRVFQDGLSCRL